MRFIEEDGDVYVDYISVIISYGKFNNLDRRSRTTTVCGV